MTRLLTICCLWFLLACVIALGQGCVSAPVGDWQFTEYRPPQCHQVGLFSQKEMKTIYHLECEEGPQPTGNFFRLEQVKE